MSWMIAATLGSAALGAHSANQQRKSQERANQQQGAISAAQQEMSPWTGVKAQEYNPQAVTGDPLSGAIQGGVSGAMAGYGVKKGMAEDAALADAAKKSQEEEERRKMMELMNPDQARG